MTNEGVSRTWPHRDLEWPELDDTGQINWDMIWLHRSKKGVQSPRPHFTGDVFENVSLIGEDAPATVVVLQHPCALLDKDNELRSVLHVAKLIDYRAALPREWLGNYDLMPLVVQEGDSPKHQAVAFDQPALAQSSGLGLSNRVACMEIEGAALLLQRWTNANTRVVVPCWRLVQVIEEQFAETDGMESWCAQRRRARVSYADAAREASLWLDEKSDDTGRPRRELLKEPQYRKHIVRKMELMAKSMSDQEIAERSRFNAERQARREAENSAVAKPEASTESNTSPLGEDEINTDRQ